MVGPRGFEPLTPALSARCSNHLSYGPKYIILSYYLKKYIIQVNKSDLICKFNAYKIASIATFTIFIDVKKLLK
jgi:hypothetical protein